MADYIPKFMPGAAVTFTASTAITGGRLVAATGERTVGPAGEDSAGVVGVAARDAKAGEQVTVYIGRQIHRLPAAEAITAGTTVSSAVGGKVAATGTNKLGLALTSAAEADDVVEVMI